MLPHRLQLIHNGQKHSWEVGFESSQGNLFKINIRPSSSISLIYIFFKWNKNWLKFCLVITTDGSLMMEEAYISWPIIRKGSCH